MPHETNTESVLLVDDDTFLLDRYAQKFEMNGFRVVKTNSALHALEELRGGLKPSIIVLDIMMPDMDGYGFLQAMQNEKLAPQAVKVALSSMTDDPGVEKAKSLGADGYMAKASATPSEVIDAILALATDVRQGRAT